VPIFAEVYNAGMPNVDCVFVVDDDDETRREAKEMGAVGFFRKPVDCKAMIPVVEWALGEPQNSNNVHVNSS